MIKWFKRLSREGLEKLLFFGVLVLVFGVFILAFTLGEEDTPIEEPNAPSEELPDESDKPNETVVLEVFKIPCDLENYTVMRKFYSVESGTEEQEMSVIQFGSKYFLSRGISLKDENNKEFNVLATMSGTVKEVTESPIYGVSVIIDHGDGFESEYISLKEANVSIGDNVEQGQKIGTSGENEYDASAENHVHFKISKNGVYYNPLNVLGKKKLELN